MIRSLGEWGPCVDKTVFVYPTAQVIGRVVLKKEASVWPGAVLRGDIEEIVVGEQTNIQDNAVLHTDPGIPLVLGTGVSVGHGAILHSCSVGDGALIGMGAIVLSGAKVGAGALVAAGALVPSGACVGEGRLVMGSPARDVRALTEEEVFHQKNNATHYVHMAQRYGSH